MVFCETDDTLVVGAIGIMKIRFVDENHRLRRSRCEEISKFVLWRYAGGRVVWVADVNQTRFRGITHLRKVMLKTAGQRHLDDLSAIRTGIIKNCFKSRIRRHELPGLRSSECLCTEFQDFARTIA